MSETNLDVKDLSLLTSVSDKDRILVTKESTGHSAAALTVANLKTKILDGYHKQFKRYYSITVGGSTSNFYPVTWKAATQTAEISIHSRGALAADPHNRNVIRFTLTAQGWSDMPKRLNVYEFAAYDSSEIQIHSIYYGNQNGSNVIYLRGGLTYYIDSNITLTPRTSTFIDGNESYGIMNSDGSVAVSNATKCWSYSTGTTISANTSSATKLQTARTIWGQSFNGTTNVAGALSGATTGSFSGVVTANRFVIADTAGNAGIKFSRNGFNYIASPSDSTSARIAIAGRGITSQCELIIGNYSVCPQINNSVSSGLSSSRWSNVYSVLGNFSGDIVVGGEVKAYSDIRLKQEVQDLDFRGKLTPKSYIKDGKKCIGFIAQEVRTLYPELVEESPSTEKFLSLNYNGITAVLQAQLNKMEAYITTLENRISELEKENSNKTIINLNY